MQSLAEAITRLKIEHNLPDPEVDPRQLIGLAPTERIREQLAAIERVQPGDADPSEPEFGWTLDRRTIERRRRWLEKDLGRALIRDALQAERPEGCWCLGAAGKEPRYCQDGTEVLSVYCPCEDGQARKAADDETRQRIHAERAAARAERVFAEAKVPARFQSCTFETYPVSDETRDAVAAIRFWASGPPLDAPEEEGAAWLLKRKRSLLLHGPYGTGKTGLAVSILRDEGVIEGGALFFTVPSLLDAIRATYGPKAEHDEREVIEAVKSAPFLVLDDLGAERVTDWVREKLFTVINHRHDEDLPTVFTSNLDVAELGEHIGERVTWRLVEMCEVIRVAGPNLRAR